MKKIILLLCLILISKVQAQTFDFNAIGDDDSNKILKEFIKPKISDDNFQVISYFEDINNDGTKEVIGIIKHKYFYSLAGYKLFVLKKNNSIWENFKSDIYFDNTQKFEIKNQKITYYKTIFYKNKKCIAKIKKNKIKTSKSLFGYFKDKQAQNIEEITKFSEGRIQNNLNIEDFHPQSQKSVNINYVNLNEKTKHYLDLK